MPLKNSLARFFYTGFFTGYAPFASGTAGTLAALAIYLGIYCIFGDLVRWINMGIVVVLVYPAIKLGDYAERLIGTTDPGEVVLDEMLGFWISLFGLPFNVVAVFAAFVLFRIFDIVKPFPAGWAQKNLPAGAGIMVDDYIAGLYTLGILWGYYLLIGEFPAIPFIECS